MKIKTLLFALLCASSAFAQTLCTGAPGADVPAEVTAAMSAVAPGVKVYQLTGLDANGKVITTASGLPNWNYVSNVDQVNFTRLGGGYFLMNSGQGSAFVKAVKADHSGAYIVSTLRGSHVHVSADGTVIAQSVEHRQNLPDTRPGTDIGITNLATAGPCATNYVTTLGFTAATNNGASGDPTTNPSWDATKNKYVVGFAPGGGNSPQPPVVYTVYSDGSPAYGPIEPNDSCKGHVASDGLPDIVYHGIRLDWKFPYLIHIGRENGTTPGSKQCEDFMDLRSGKTWEWGDPIAGSKHLYGNHNDQNYDGQRWVTTGSLLSGGWVWARLVVNGAFVSGSNYPWSLLNLHGYHQLISATSPVSSDFCSWLNNYAMLCASKFGTGRSDGGQPFPGYTLSSTCYPIFEVSWNAIYSTTFKFVSCSDGYHVANQYEGVTVAKLAYVDSKGLAHALFRSNKSGEPQTYELIFRP